MALELHLQLRSGNSRAGEGGHAPLQPGESHEVTIEAAHPLTRSVVPSISMGTGRTVPGLTRSDCSMSERKTCRGLAPGEGGPPARATAEPVVTTRLRLSLACLRTAASVAVEDP